MLEFKLCTLEDKREVMNELRGEEGDDVGEDNLGEKVCVMS